MQKKRDHFKASVLIDPLVDHYWRADVWMSGGLIDSASRFFLHQFGFSIQGWCIKPYLYIYLYDLVYNKEVLG